MGKGRICIWIIRPVVTAPAFLPLQRCPGDQSADLCQIFQLYQFSQTPSRSAAGDLRLQICQLRQVLLKSGLAADNHQGFVRALLQGLQQVSAFPSGAGGQLLQPPGDLSCRRLSSWVTSSQLESYPVENVTDENLKTFWVAGKNDDKQWVEIDLEEVSDVYALQLNFFDYEETGFWGRMPNLRQRYLVEASVDGARWRVLVDYRNSFRDAPHNYIELDQPIEARYIRYRHHYVPGKNLAMGNIRVFGLGRGKKPATVKGFTVVREADERNVRISWKAVKGAQGYNVLWGVAPDKLYSSWMVYGDNSLDLRALTVGQKYYFAIEAFNENGISQRVFLREAH